MVPRLLTSYARLSIPSRKELNNVKVPVLALLENFLDMGANLLGFNREEDHSLVIYGRLCRRAPAGPWKSINLQAAASAAELKNSMAR